VVILQSVSRDDLPDVGGALSGNPVYTVYLKVGDEREWLLEYCIPGTVNIKNSLSAPVTFTSGGPNAARIVTWGVPLAICSASGKGYRFSANPRTALLAIDVSVSIGRVCLAATVPMVSVPLLPACGWEAVAGFMGAASCRMSDRRLGPAGHQPLGRTSSKPTPTRSSAVRVSIG